MNRAEPRTQEVRITSGGVQLDGTLTTPAHPIGVVLFAHGSGSSRHSPRNRSVATLLNDGNFATLLLDLLTQQEEVIDESTAEFRFDIPLLADRLAGAIDWLGTQESIGRLPIGLFGASTGAAAALIAAAARPARVVSVVSRGGRPDLAESALERVAAPVLLLVGGEDDVVIELNQQAFDRLRCEKRMIIIPGATHLFEEPGTLDQVARHALAWFIAHARRHPVPPDAAQEAEAPF